MSAQIRTLTEESQIAPTLKWLEGMLTWGVRQYGAVMLSVSQVKRTLEQNAKMWPMLTDISKQVTWFDQKLSPEEWKDLATGSFRGCKILPSMEGDGRFVTVGLSTSRMGKKDFSDFITYLYAFGDGEGVKWSEQSLATYEEYREAA